jgi:hypothetical protein
MPTSTSMLVDLEALVLLLHVLVLLLVLYVLVPT